MTLKELLMVTNESRMSIRVYTMLPTTHWVGELEVNDSSDYISSSLATREELLYGNEELNSDVATFKRIENREVEYFNIHLQNSHLQMWIRLK